MGSLLLNEHVTSFFFLLFFFPSREKETALDGRRVSCRHSACCMYFISTWSAFAERPLVLLCALNGAGTYTSKHPLLLQDEHSIH